MVSPQLQLSAQAWYHQDDFHSQASEVCERLFMESISFMEGRLKLSKCRQSFQRHCATNISLCIDVDTIRAHDSE